MRKNSFLLGYTKCGLTEILSPHLSFNCLNNSFCLIFKLHCYLLLFQEEYNGSGQLTPGTGHRRKRHKRRGIKREPNRGDSSNEEEPASKMSNDRRDPDRARVKKEANNDSGSDSNVIVIKEELDDCWNESGTPDNASFGQYMNMPSTSQDQNFTSLSDMSLLPIGSQDSGQVWSQAAAYASGGSMGRGLSRSSTSTSTSQLDPSQEVSIKPSLSEARENMVSCVVDQGLYQ